MCCNYSNLSPFLPPYLCDASTHETCWIPPTEPFTDSLLYLIQTEVSALARNIDDHDVRNLTWEIQR